jgi:predicted small secreted protein
MFRKLVMMLFALAVGTSALTLTGCNTVSGAGKDVAAAGNKVTEEAQEHKKY